MIKISLDQQPHNTAEVRASMLRIALDGNVQPVDATNIAELCRIYLADIADALSPKTVRHYRNRLRTFLAWWNDVGPPDYILTESTLRSFRRWLETEHRTAHGKRPKPGTIYTIINCTRIFLRWLHKTGRIPIDISGWIPLPPKPKGKQRFLSLEQCQMLFDAVPTGSLRFRDLAMLAFLLGTGARRSEAANALWEHTEIADDFTGHCHLFKVKGDAEGRGRGRVVVFGPATGKLLHFHRQFLRITGQEDDRIFGMSGTAIKMRFRVLQSEVGFPVGPHDFRRTFSDWWFERNHQNDLALTLLKMQLGHTLADDVTLRHYVNLGNKHRLIRMLTVVSVSPVESIEIPVNL